MGAQVGGVTVNPTIQNQASGSGGPSILHDVGQLAGHALNALPGYSTLGSNITNPAVNYQGAANPGYASTPSSSAQVQGAATTDPSGGSLSGGSAAANASSLLGQAYDQQIGAFQNQLNQLPTYQDLSNNIINGDYSTQKGGLDSQYATGQANQQLAQNALDTSQANSVRDLGSQLRGALAGYNNQLGVQGAGNSSAAQMIGYALQQQGNTGMNDLNTQYNQQQQGLNVAGSALDTQYQQNVKALDQWKNDNLQQIAMSYAQQAQQIANSMQGASVSKAYALQNAGSAAAQQALDQMKSLESQYGNAATQLQQSYQQASAPTADISQYANAFSTSPLSTQQIQATNLANNQQNTDTTASNIPVSLQKKDITQPF